MYNQDNFLTTKVETLNIHLKDIYKLTNYKHWLKSTFPEKKPENKKRTYNIINNQKKLETA